GKAGHTALKFGVVGEDVLITGAGPIGLMAAAVARHAGARYVAITDVSAQRLEIAQRMGVDLALNVARTAGEQAEQRLSLRQGFDIGLDVTGHPDALAAVHQAKNHGGTTAILGLPPSPIDADCPARVTHMLTLQGIYGREMYETWNAMSAMLQTSIWLHEAISSVITTVLPATEWEAGFAEAASGTGGKVVLDWRVFD